MSTQSGNEAPPRLDDGKDDDGSPPRPRRRLLWWAIALLALLVVTSPVALLAARGPLERGRGEALRAQDALVEGDVTGALERLDRATASFRSARRRLRNPLTVVAGVLPWSGSTLRTAGALARAGELAGEGGMRALRAVEAMPQGVAALAPRQGRIPVERIASLAPAVGEAAALVADARALVARSPDLLALGPVRDARRDGLALLERADRALVTASSLATALPAFLGLEGRRTYFLGASNPAEQRGTGGFIGAWSILEADDGRLRFRGFEDIHALPKVAAGRAVAPPAADFSERYDRYGSRYRWTTVNVSPDFRSAAEVIRALYVASVGEELDGVIVADPFALQALMSSSGPVSVPGIGQVDAGGVVSLIANEAYARFEAREDRQRVLGLVAGAALQAFLRDGAGAPAAAVESLGAAARGGHLLLHSRVRAEQTAFELAGVAGALPEDRGDAFVLALNSQSNSKVDYYLDVGVELDVTLQPDGAAQTVAQVRLHNDAPTSGQPEYVIGPNMPGLSAGDNQLLVDVLCSTRCSFEGFTPQAAEVGLRLGTDHGLAALGTRVRLPSDAEETMRLAWRSEGAWTEDEGLITYRISLRGPATVRPPELRMTVHVPPDVSLVEVRGARTDAAGVITLDGTWRGNHEVSVVLTRTTSGRFLSHLRAMLGRPLPRGG